MIVRIRLYFLIGSLLLLLLANSGSSEAQTPPGAPSWNPEYGISSYSNDKPLPHPPTLPYPNVKPQSKIYPEPPPYYEPYYEPPPPGFIPAPPYPSSPDYFSKPYYSPKPSYPRKPSYRRRIYSYDWGYFSEKGLYNYGLNLVYSYRCGEAIPIFRDFLSLYPYSSLADNAVYWTGECYYRMKNYSRAAREFQKVITKYPRGNKVPDALLKKGLAYLSLGRYVSAFRTLEDLTYRYPESRSAYLARKTLNKYYNYSFYRPHVHYYRPQPKYYRLCRPCY
jgi:tol-pal system protein YbgF